MSLETREALLDRIVDADAYMATLHVRLDREAIDRAKKLKVVSTPSTVSRRKRLFCGNVS